MRESDQPISHVGSISSACYILPRLNQEAPMPKRRIQIRGRRKGRRMKGRNKHGAGTGVSATVTMSLQRIAMLFPPRSLQRVYFHGLWQRSRKRQPSLSLDNLGNPRKAFQAAEELEGAYLRTVIRLPYFRQIWTWEEPETLVQAILDHTPIHEIAYLF